MHIYIYRSSVLGNLWKTVYRENPSVSGDDGRISETYKRPGEKVRLARVLFDGVFFFLIFILFQKKKSINYFSFATANQMCRCSFENLTL